uniref:Uncharacterized protein n=1 Tax=Setaria viridis TaxID=4556 RepID=A0A4U6VSW0_SETVI|nr:hypothetical protein SEVIR_2G201850v2 [Setaria viridis]
MGFQSCTTMAFLRVTKCNVESVKLYYESQGLSLQLQHWIQLPMPS